MRLYLPATAATVRAAMRAGEFGPAPVTAFAVTPGLREAYLGDLEELEYLAQRAAARASLRLLDADPAAPRCRVVVALEAPQEAATSRDDLETGVVRIPAALPWSWVQAALVDTAEAAAAVAAGAAAVLAADLGDPDAEFAVDETEGYELGWWASQELAQLLETLD